MMRALYVGYSRGTANHGDEALQWIIRDLLAPELEVRPDWKEYDVAVLGGGTLINQSPWLIDAFQSALTRPDVHGLVFGSGVGDLAFWGNHFGRWIPLLERCEAVGVRGPDSARLLSEQGFTRAIVCGDPYLSLQSPILRRTPFHKRLGVNIGRTNDSLWGIDDKKLYEIVRDALFLLASQGWSFSLVSVWDRDLEVIEQLAEEIRVKTGQDCLCLDARAQTLEVYSVLAQCEAFLGEKLHACAMAAVANVPFVALEYQPKVRDFARSLGMQNHTISTEVLEPASVVAAVKALHANRLRIQRSLKRRRIELRHRLFAFAEEAKTAVLASSQASL